MAFLPLKQSLLYPCHIKTGTIEHTFSVSLCMCSGKLPLDFPRLEQCMRLMLMHHIKTETAMFRTFIPCLHNQAQVARSTRERFKISKFIVFYLYYKNLLRLAAFLWERPDKVSWNLIGGEGCVRVVPFATTRT